MKTIIVDGVTIQVDETCEVVIDGKTVTVRTKEPAPLTYVPTYPVPVVIPYQYPPTLPIQPLPYPQFTITC